MIFVVDAAVRGHFAAELSAMHRQRKAVFVDRAGWKIPVAAGQEADRYDYLPDTVYLLAKDQARGPVLASARLLTTAGPHLMQALYSEADRAAVPSGPTVWEASRFCTSPEIPGRARRLALLWEIICGVMELGLARGIDQVIFAANRALLPLALGCGWASRPVAPTMPDGDDEFTAVAASVTPDGLHTVRHRHHIPDPIIRALEPSDCTASGTFGHPAPAAPELVSAARSP